MGSGASSSSSDTCSGSSSTAGSCISSSRSSISSKFEAYGNGGAQPLPRTSCAVARLNRLLDRRPRGMRSMLRLIAAISETTPSERLELVQAGVFRRLCLMVRQNRSFEASQTSLKERQCQTENVDSKKSANNNTNENNNSNNEASSPATARAAFPGDASRGASGTPSSGSRGVGYGRGSTKSHWNVERALEARVAHEEHLMWLLCALTTFLWGDASLGSGGRMPVLTRNATADVPPHFCSELVDELVSTANILQLLECHLSNDSVFDISQHIDFYQALFELFVALTVVPDFLPLLCRVDEEADAVGDGKSVVHDLILRFRDTLNAYAQMARSNASPDFVLMDFIGKVNEYTEIITKSVGFSRSCDDDKTNAACQSESDTDGATDDELYAKTMRELQFQTKRLVTDENRGLGYTFRKELRNISLFSTTLKDRTKRINKELASMHNSLPLNASNAIFVCMDETRCDVLKVLISGPQDTPYEDGLFEFDVFFPNNYPISPPKCASLTTGNGTVRFNPNLYSDGKICLSILGTWEGRPEEKWNSFCSILQVLVSIQGLIFVKNPYFNEPGLEKLEGTADGDLLSLRYNSFIEYATLLHAIGEHYRHPSSHFRDVILRHCWLKRDAIIARAERWLLNMARHANLFDNAARADGVVVGGPDTSLLENDGTPGQTKLLTPLIQRQNVRKLIEEFRAMKNPAE